MPAVARRRGLTIAFGTGDKAQVDVGTTVRLHDQVFPSGHGRRIPNVGKFCRHVATSHGLVVQRPLVLGLGDPDIEDGERYYIYNFQHFIYTL